MVRKVLTSVFAIAVMFVCMTSAALAQTQVINWENAALGSNAFGQQNLTATSTITDLLVESGDPDLTGNYMGGQANNIASFAHFTWDFDNVAANFTGTATLSYTVADWGQNFSFEMRDDNDLSSNGGLEVGANGSMGFGSAAFDDGNGDWEGEAQFPVPNQESDGALKIAAEIPYVNGNSQGQYATMRYTMVSGTNAGATWSTTMELLQSVERLRVFYEREIPSMEHNMKFDDLTFLVPEPGTVGLLLLGLVGMGCTRSWIRRRRS